MVDAYFEKGRAPLHLKEVASALGVSYATVHNHSEDLADAGLAVRITGGGGWSSDRPFVAPSETLIENLDQPLFRDLLELGRFVLESKT